MIKISVIIPVYKVEAFIGRCADSLFGQTMQEDIEYIFVDDASPDNSMSVVRECLGHFPERQAQVKFFAHQKNCGLPAARNTGLTHAVGEYVFHCDSDDFLEKRALERMYNRAKERDADIVWCDWFLSLKQSERYMKQPDYTTPDEALKGMLGGAMKFNVWNKLVRRQLYIENQLTFPAGHNMGEDMLMIRLFACAKKVCYLPEAFYHYVRVNANGLTQMQDNEKINLRHLEDIKYNADLTTGYIRQKFGHQLDKYIACFQLQVKFPFLISGNSRKYELWQKWFPEANRYIWDNKQISFRSRLLEWMASKGQFWYVRCYYVLLMKVVYGVFYK